METAIRDFPKQFTFEPEIQNADKLPQKDRLVVCGMGGSHLAADLLRIVDPHLPLTIHSDYGLPALSPEDAAKTLMIASSYSGNTEETLDAIEQAMNAGYAIAVITVDGKLLQDANEHLLPYVVLPDTGIQPRCALGFNLMALLKLTGRDDVLTHLRALSTSLDIEACKRDGEHLAEQLKDFVPIVYASTANAPIAYNWKIKLNETGKIPAFYNVVPELNHNEMTGFDVKNSTKHLSERFAIVLLRDTTDHPKNQQRMEVVKKLYHDRGLKVVEYTMRGTLYEKMFSTLLVADWIALILASQYGVESEHVPMVEEFKNLIR